MTIYKEMYLRLFGEVSRIIEELQEIQRKVEAMHMLADEPEE